jgi:hypothetical protein
MCAAGNGCVETRNVPRLHEVECENPVTAERYTYVFSVRETMTRFRTRLEFSYAINGTRSISDRETRTAAPGARSSHQHLRMLQKMPFASCFMPSGYYTYRQNSAFCPYSVSVCSVRDSTVNRINLLVFVMEAQRIFCGTGSEFHRDVPVRISAGTFSILRLYVVALRQST